MGAGASQPGAAGATSPNTASTAAPNHHIAIGGLTGITHGAQRHVTWSLYHETGYHTIHLQHDGFTGRRLLQCDGQDLFYKKFSYALFDSSSSHSFVLATLALLDSKEAAAAAASRPSSAAPHSSRGHRPAASASSSSSSSFASSSSLASSSSRPTVVTVNIEEKDTYFLYTAQVDGQQYREYQQSFWRRSAIFSLPVRDMRHRHRHRGGVEEGIGDSQHSVVVIHSPAFTVLVNGRAVQTDSAFAANDALLHRFSIEPEMQAEYSLYPLLSPAASLRHSKGIAVEGGNVGVLYGYRLTVGGVEIAEMKPPLLPSAWKDGSGGEDAIRKEKVKEELQKTANKAEEQKE